MDIIEMENALKRAKIEQEIAAKKARLLELKKQMLELEFNKAKLKIEADRVEQSILETEAQLGA